MKLAHALEILQGPAEPDRPAFSVSLACGFESLHLRTLLAAELQQRLPAARVDVSTGLFDDLLGTLERAATTRADAVAVVIEWSDIDPRLGVRRLGGWRVTDLTEVVADADIQLDRLERRLVHAANVTRVVCVMPTLPLPPLFPQPPGRSGPEELSLRGAVAACAARLAAHPGVSVANQQSLDASSPPAGRRDIDGELNTGFPYSLHHAAAVAAQLAELIWTRPSKKGLITDLDDTLWAGILDELGAEGVSWDAEAHRYGLYQQLLASLSSAGVLIGVASRNDPHLVAQVLARRDLLIAPDAIFPVEAHWGAKSQSIRRILDTWNVAADAVVFVDDSPLELDQARAALPGLEAVTVPRDEDELWAFLTRLRGLFGKGAVTEDDGLRLESIRSGSAFAQAGESARDGDDFLAGVGGAITFSTEGVHRARALELIAKTNQFNLNGHRLTEADVAGTAERGGHLVTVTYGDRYGSLGTVGAVLVSPLANGLLIDAWAMSCRAFARRIEHHTLRYLFDRFGVPEITLAFRDTERNLALREFLASMVGDEPPEPPEPHEPPTQPGPAVVTRTNFEARTPPLVHATSDDGS
jgi:FkbH-like protein